MNWLEYKRARFEWEQLWKQVSGTFEPHPLLETFTIKIWQESLLKELDSTTDDEQKEVLLAKLLFIQDELLKEDRQ